MHVSTLSVPKQPRRSLAALAAFTLGLFAAADTDYPRSSWQDRPNPLASPDAVVGGEISIFAGQWPKSFNYYLDNNVFSSEVFGAMFETLLGTDPVDPARYVPGLAHRWRISSDKRTFTFWIDPKARWSDGRPVTARDVQWTFSAIMDPKNMTGPHKVALERFRPPTLVDRLCIRFTANEVHWRNLMAVGGLQILPAHAFTGRDFNMINFSFPVVSGPYRLGKIREGVFVTLERRSDWWNRGAPSNRHTGNFQTLMFRFYGERENAFEAFKKGQIDLFPVYTARLWINQTRGDKFLRNWIVRQKVYNHKPIGFQGFAMNMRRPPFDDLRVRKAMAHLVDRRRMNRLLMYNQYFLHRSYYEDLYSKDRPCPNPIIEFDKSVARKLLSQAGWRANPQTGLLEKNGRVFEFKFLTRSASTDRFLAIFAEDLKDVGVRLIIDRKDWAAWARDMDQFNFDMTWAAWGAGIFKDPEGMWSSKEADRKGGSNITGFKDPEVDRLIEKQKSIFDLNLRNEICRRIDRIAVRRFPYVLLWNLNYTRLLYWNKFGMPDTVLSKYGDESSAYWYWWFDEDSAADLEDAVENGIALPRRREKVVFDEIFHPTR
ncbi:MAG: ABC transporter substrate-binding protein [Kiritimatiellaeota bacterium]|nr:ABC transporter substrate-binding protein [Kiritimatiellota bacterium]